MVFPSVGHPRGQPFKKGILRVLFRCRPLEENKAPQSRGRSGWPVAHAEVALLSDFFPWVGFTAEQVWPFCKILKR
jgi:hypothetical protein